MDAQLKKGLLEICVLKAIAREESYGYKIISDLEPYIEISESTLYPILKRLEAGGAVVTRNAIFNGRLRKYFSITEVGLARIADFIDTMDEFRRVSDYILKSDDRGDEL